MVDYNVIGTHIVLTGRCVALLRGPCSYRAGTEGQKRKRRCTVFVPLCPFRQAGLGTRSVGFFVPQCGVKEEEIGGERPYDS